MRVLFYTSEVLSSKPHLEIELELISKHIKNEDEVFVTDDISCFHRTRINPHFDKHTSFLCKNKLRYGLSLIPGFNFANIVSLPKLKLQEDFTKIFFSDIKELMKYELAGFSIGNAVASSLISKYRDHFYDTAKNRLVVLQYLQLAWYVHEAMSIVLDSVKPDLVYIFNGRFVEQCSVVYLCQKKNIKFNTYDRADVLNKYRLFINTVPLDLQYNKNEIIRIWDNGADDKEQIAEKYYKDRRSGLNQGWFSFTNKQKPGKLPVDFSDKQRNIVVYNSSLDEYESVKEYSNHIYKDEIEGIYKIVEDMQNEQGIHFYLRIHPNLRNLENTQIKLLRELHKRGLKNLTVIFPEEDVSTYALLDNCEKVLTFMSTAGVEAAFWGKPVILAGRSVYEDLDCVYQTKTHEETLALLKKQLSPKPKLGTLKYGYFLATAGENAYEFSQTAVAEVTFHGQNIQPRLKPLEKIFVFFLIIEKFLHPARIWHVLKNKIFKQFASKPRK